MTAVISGTNGLLQSYDYQVLTTGFTYTFAAGTQVLVINPAGTLATGTITMPASPADGMTITFSSGQRITALTMSGNGATINNAITSLDAKQAVSYMYRATGTTWYILGTQATQAAGPAFSAYFNGSTQSISASTWTKVTMNAEDFDTNSNYDTTNYRFTPTVAGYYQITGIMFFNIGSASATGASVAIYKNGSIYKGAGTYSLANGAMEGSISLPILFNGSTDYVEIYVWISTASNTYIGSTNTGYGGAGGVNALFNGYFIRGT
jgi:hypothetical protein